jgi:hypothetical protein
MDDPPGITLRRSSEDFSDLESSACRIDYFFATGINSRARFLPGSRNRLILIPRHHRQRRCLPSMHACVSRQSRVSRYRCPTAHLPLSTLSILRGKDIKSVGCLSLERIAIVLSDPGFIGDDFPRVMVCSEVQLVVYRVCLFHLCTVPRYVDVWPGVIASTDHLKCNT